MFVLPLSFNSTLSSVTKLSLLMFVLPLSFNPPLSSFTKLSPVPYLRALTELAVKSPRFFSKKKKKITIRFCLSKGRQQQPKRLKMHSVVNLKSVNIATERYVITCFLENEHYNPCFASASAIYIYWFFRLSLSIISIVTWPRSGWTWNKAPTKVSFRNPQVAMKAAGTRTWKSRIQQLYKMLNRTRCT